MAQDRERAIVERLGEEAYIRSLLEKLDVTNPEALRADGSLNKSLVS